MTRPLRTRRLLAAVAVAPLLSTALVACGGNGDEEASDPAASSSTSESSDAETDAAETEDAGTGDLEEGQTVEPSAFVDIVAGGVEASTTANVTQRSSFGGTEFGGEGVVDYTTKPPSIAMTNDNPAGGGETKVVSVDGITYMNLGALSQGKYWKFDPADASGPLAEMGLDKILQQSDPLAALQAMEDSIDSVTYVGEEDVDGRDLDHYEMTVDLQASLETLGTDLPPAATKGMPKTIAYDLWLDEEDRFGRMVMDIPMGGQEITTEMVLDDWGTDVTIEAPPADQVTDMPKMPGGAGGGVAG